MLYTKNDDKRYTMMCKEFDEEFPRPDRNDTKLYKTMYLVFYMLACKENFFNNNFRYYDEYAQFAATTIYTRFLKKLSKGEKVKSLLNYAKASMRFLKTMYQNENFETVISPEHGVDTDKLSTNIHDAIVSDYSSGLAEDIQRELASIDNVINDVLDDTNYSHDKLIRHRLYISCMLTLLDSITLPRDSYLLKSRAKGKNVNDNVFVEALAKERDNQPILWNLDSTMSSTVKIIVNRVRKDLSSAINDISKDHTLPDDVVDLILSNAFSEGKLCVEKDEDYD